MKIQSLLLGLWTLLELFGLCSSFDDFVPFPDDPSVVYTYNRFTEIENHCKPFLYSASELKPDDSRGYRLKNELSFFHGDWDQEAGGAPLMPFDDSEMPLQSSSVISPLKFVNFEVKDVNSVHQSKNKVSLTGLLYIGISRNSTYFFDSQSMFYMRPGLSALKIVFEGVYIETEENGGERLLCLLGNTTLPSWNWNDDFLDLTSNVNSYYNRQPQLLQDDQIFLVLRYPQTFNLTKRAILGEMRTLNKRESFKFFDKVHIYSQLSRFSKYQFSTENLKSRSCDPFPLVDEFEEDGVNMLTGTKFCRFLREISDEVYDVEPSWKISGRYEHSSRVGPFMLGKENKAIGWSYNDVKLIMQNIMCEQETTDNETESVRVSALLRAFPATMMEWDIAARRTGLSGTTLSVEGVWNSSIGKLCMVGCLGVVNSGLEGCNSQILLYIPRSFSSRQRSIMFGSISSIRNETDSYFPILFGVATSPTILSKYGLYLSYNYSKTDIVGVFRKRSQPSQVITFIRESLLTYPALGDRNDLFFRLHLLSSDLCIYAYALPVPVVNGHKPEIFVQVEVLSLGPLVGRYAPLLYKDGSSVSDQAELTKSEVLNVSLHLMLTEAPLRFSEKSNKHFSKLFLEGLYDPVVGEMYLIGCRKVIVEGINIERGLDCSINVKIEYPSESTLWVFIPITKITITSQRNDNDPLHFSPISLQTFMISSRKHERAVLFRKSFEAILRILMLLVSVAITLSQLFYMKKNVEAIPYISLVMLAIQVLGYSLPLISNSEILFKSKESESYRLQCYSFQEYELFFKILDCTGKFLSLAGLLLTARLFQNVSESRNELHWTSKPRCVPSDKQVLLITLFIVIFLFLISHGTLLPLIKDAYTRGDTHLLQFWVVKLGDYLICLVLDFFLLPQIIGNKLWQFRGKPFRRAYIYGFTLLRIFPYLYDCIRDPVVAPYPNTIRP